MAPMAPLEILPSSLDKDQTTGTNLLLFNNKHNISDFCDLSMFRTRIMYCNKIETLILFPYGTTKNLYRPIFITNLSNHGRNIWVSEPMEDNFMYISSKIFDELDYIQTRVDDYDQNRLLKNLVPS